MVPEFKFPQYDLARSIDVARKIASRGAGATVTMDELAAFLGYKSANNGAFVTRVSAARMFGLVDGPRSASAITPRADAILHPDYPETAERAKLDAFRAVPLFTAFLDAFQGRPLPDDTGMVNALVTRFKVPQKEARAVLVRLLDSADEAGLFRVGGTGRMIEPSYPAKTVIATADTSTASTSDMTPTEPFTWITTEQTRRFPKIIEGALDLMPNGPPWDQSEYEDWLAYFDHSCRMFFRIGRKGTPP